jgi:hypothetical protein
VRAIIQPSATLLCAQTPDHESFTRRSSNLLVLYIVEQPFVPLTSHLHPRSSMAPSLLRRKKQAQVQKPEPKPSPPLRHSLSLPDLTTPLLDPASWEDLPAPVSPDVQSTPLSPRPRKTSIINGGTPVQFHRPFTPWQVVINPDSPPQDDGTPGDFRTSRARWGRDSTATGRTQMSGFSGISGMSAPGLGGGGWKKRAKSKAMGRLNVIVVGARGVGKTR